MEPLSVDYRRSVWQNQAWATTLLKMRLAPLLGVFQGPA